MIEDEQLPHAAIGPKESLARAVSAILAQHEFWSLSTEDAVRIGMKAVNGTGHPDQIRNAFRELRAERGIKGD